MMLSIFRRGRKRAAIVVPQETEIPGQALSDGGWLTMIWRLTSISRPEFYATYEPFLVRASQMMGRSRTLDLDSASVVAEQQLMHLIVTILKVRKARIIPRHAGLEDAARMSETMSFALVVACVLEQVLIGWRQADLTVRKTSVCPLVDGFDDGHLIPRKTSLEPGASLLFLPSLLTPIAMRWLWKEPHVLNELTLFFNNSPKGEFRQLMQLAKHKAGLVATRRAEAKEEPALAERVAASQAEPPKVENDESPDNQSAPAELAELDEHVELPTLSEVADLSDADPINDEFSIEPMAPDELEEPELELEPPESAEMVGLESPEPVEPSVDVVEEKPQQGELLPPNPPRKRRKVGTDFEGWLRAELESGDLIANEEDSVLHQLADGTVFLIQPHTLNRFAAESGQRAKQILNKMARMGTIAKRTNGRSLFYATHPSRGPVIGLVLLRRKALFGSPRVRTSKFISKVTMD